MSAQGSATAIAAYLAEARRRWEVFGEAGSLPALLAAVEAGLARHQRSDLDLRCPAHAYAPPSRAFPAARGCPDCTYREHRVCANPDCREHEWPCPDHEAITTELLRGDHDE